MSDNVVSMLQYRSESASISASVGVWSPLMPYIALDSIVD